LSTTQKAWATSIHMLRKFWPKCAWRQFLGLCLSSQGPCSRKLEISRKDLDKPLLSASPHLKNLNCFYPMFKKHGTSPKRLRQFHSLSKKPKHGPKPMPRSLNCLHMLRKSNALRSKRVILCPKAFAKWEAFISPRGKEPQPLNSKM